MSVQKNIKKIHVFLDLAKNAKNVFSFFNVFLNVSLKHQLSRFFWIFEKRKNIFSNSTTINNNYYNYSPCVVCLNMRTPAGGNMIGANTLATTVPSVGMNLSNCNTKTNEMTTSRCYWEDSRHDTWPCHGQLLAYLTLPSSTASIPEDNFRSILTVLEILPVLYAQSQFFDTTLLFRLRFGVFPLE